MKTDRDLVDALATGLRDMPNHPVPTDLLFSLSQVAKPGRHVTIDVEASTRVGAVVVTVDDAQPHDLFEPLTARQRDVARCLVAGQSNKEIARTLGIALGTVKDHVHAILQRLDLPTRAAVIAASRAHLQR